MGLSGIPGPRSRSVSSLGWNDGSRVVARRPVREMSEPQNQRVEGDEPRMARAWTCECACHKCGVVLHPVPCCLRCPLCGAMVPRENQTHTCAAISPSSHAQGPTRAAFLVAKRYEVALPVLMVLLTMGLAVYAAGRLSGVLIGAAAVGGLVAVVKLRRPRH